MVAHAMSFFILSSNKLPLKRLKTWKFMLCLMEYISLQLNTSYGFALENSSEIDSLENQFNSTVRR